MKNNGTRICIFAGCDRVYKTKGYCHTHYTQIRNGKTLAPIRTYLHAAIKDENGKTCTGCGVYQPYDNFYDEGRVSRCKACFTVEVVERRRKKRSEAL